MTVAPKETQAIPAQIEGNKDAGNDNEIVHTPTQSKVWTQGVEQEFQRIPEVGSSTGHDFTPTASEPISDSKALQEAGAERVGVEPQFPLSLGDARHHIETLVAPVIGEEPGTYNRSIPGSKVVSFVRAKAQRLKRALQQKAA